MRRVLVSLLFLAGCAGQVELESPLTPSVVADAGTPVGIPVLYVNGNAQHVSVHNFWGAPGHPLGTGMRWEAIAEGNPWNPSGYINADGYGGGHALLFSGSSGNIFFDQGTPAEQIISFASLDVPPPGVFSHVQVTIESDAYSKPSIVVRENGIPCSRTFIPAGAQRTTAGSGSGTLFIGGSDHSNFVGWIAAARGWDTVSAIDVAPSQAMIPPRWFDGVGPNGEPADFLMSFVSPYLITYPDLSSGYDSAGQFVRRIQHPGVPYTGLDYADVFWNPPVTPSALPTVKYVTNAPFDPTYNETNSAQVTALKRGCVKDPTPTGAKLFDSFCRQDREFFHHERPDVGSLEVDTVGTNPRWQTGSPTGVTPSVPAAGTGEKYAVGLYNRSPVPLDYMPTLMWAPSNSGDGQVVVTRRSHVDTGSDGQIGIVFRVQDESHYWAFFFQNVQAGDGTVIDRRFYLMRWDGYGGAAFLAAADMPAGLDNFARLSVTTNGSSITGSADGVPLITVTDSTYATATGMGLYLVSALSRAYDFTVF
jgi:hypothetical protein